MKEKFKKFLRAHGIDPDGGMDEKTRATMEAIFDQLEAAEARAGEGDSQAANAARERTTLILGTASAAVATANDTVKAGVLGRAIELAGDEKVSLVEAQRKIGEYLTELAKKASAGTNPTGTADDQRAEFVLPADPEAVLSRAEIVAAFGEVRDDRAIYARAAQSLVAHQDGGHALSGERLFADLDKRQGALVIHEEVGRPRRRTITASSANVAIQTVSTALLQRAYNERPDQTDQLVRTIPGGADEVTFPEVETDTGVKRLKENEPYPFLGGTEQEVKSGFIKYGGAIAQTRENNLFDKLGRTLVYLGSLARQLKRHRREFRLARICDSVAVDGRYIARPGNDNGTAAFYSGTVDHRQNKNLLASNALEDETDLDVAVGLLESMKLLDGTNVMPELRVILVDSTQKTTAWKILNSIYAPSVAAASGMVQAAIPNPYGPEGMYATRPVIIADPKVGTYAGAATTWFAGDPQAQFFEIEHWPIEIVPVLVSGEMQLRDIHSAWKGGFCIDLIALSNMFFVKCTAA